MAGAPKLGVTEKPALAPDLFVARNCVEPKPPGFVSDWTVLEEAGTPILDVNENPVAGVGCTVEPDRLRFAPNFGIAPISVDAGTPLPPVKENPAGAPDLEVEPPKFAAVKANPAEGAAGFDAGCVVVDPNKFFTIPGWVVELTGTPGKKRKMSHQIYRPYRYNDLVLPLQISS